MNRPAIHALPTAINDAERLASRLGVPLHPIDVHFFPDGELRVTVGPPSATAIVYAPLDRPNDKLLILLFAAEAFRREGARRLVLTAPYLCYMRQDAAFHRGEAINQKVIGSLLAGSFDRMITVDAHLHRTKNIEDVFPGIESDDLSAMPAIADVLRGSGISHETVVTGPDEESRPWVRDLAARLDLKHAVGHKSRRDDKSVEIGFDNSGLFKGRPALLVDDIVSSGGTLLACTKALLGAGAIAVDVVVTHALFTSEMIRSFRDAGVRSIRSTTSVPHATNAIALDGILADALRKELGP
ncbi:MAG TPA: ribose-phosphate diphosphokinase [Pseudolabrys sp.]|nr:ribose-phosphate diphosphokinase [Pseudolabrys sp.]